MLSIVYFWLAIGQYISILNDMSIHVFIRLCNIYVYFAYCETNHSSPMNYCHISSTKYNHYQPIIVVTNELITNDHHTHYQPIIVITKEITPTLPQPHVLKHLDHVPPWGIWGSVDRGAGLLQIDWKPSHPALGMTRRSAVPAPGPREAPC